MLSAENIKGKRKPSRSEHGGGPVEITGRLSDFIEFISGLAGIDFLRLYNSVSDFVIHGLKTGRGGSMEFQGFIFELEVGRRIILRAERDGEAVAYIVLSG